MGFLFVKALSPRDVNTGRQFEVDMARVLALITMVLVHLFEHLSLHDTLGPIASEVIEFFGGPLSAPVYMTAMGVGIAYSSKQSPRALAHRGKDLIRQGYALNLWRGGLVYLVLYTLSGEDFWLQETVGHMLLLDILHFAGAAFLLFALLRHLKAKPWHMLLIAIVMEILTMAAPPVAENTLLPAGILGYFFYQNESTCFPLFSWFLYPVAGYCFGLILRRVSDKTGFYTRVLLLSSGLFLLLTAALYILGYPVSDIFLAMGYYAQGPLHAAWILLICGMLYSLLYFISLAIRPGRTRKVIQFISGNSNQIYVYQWVIIMWFIHFVLGETAVTSLGYYSLTAVVILLSVTLAYLRQRWAARQRSQVA